MRRRRADRRGHRRRHGADGRTIAWSRTTSSASWLFDVSQLGYMFLRWVRRLRRRVFHLYTHAFFKALMFLGSGAVIHACTAAGLRRMGCLKKQLANHLLFVPVGALAIAGVRSYPASQQDEILFQTFISGHGCCGRSVRSRRSC